jgi:hypothetical protein
VSYQSPSTLLPEISFTSDDTSFPVDNSCALQHITGCPHDPVPSYPAGLPHSLSSPRTAHCCPTIPHPFTHICPSSHLTHCHPLLILYSRSHVTFWYSRPCLPPPLSRVRQPSLASQNLMCWLLFVALTTLYCAVCGSPPHLGCEPFEG